MSFAQSQGTPFPLHHHYADPKLMPSRHIQCNGVSPCSRCRARRLDCTYARSASEFTTPISAQRAEALRNQNNRLERAVHCMAARIEALESSRLGDGGHQQLDQGSSSSSSAAGSWQANIADLLDVYAPEDADSLARLPANDETQSSTNIALDGNGKAKKRRVEETVDRQTDLDLAQSFPPYAIAPAFAYQGLALNNTLMQSTEAPVDSTGLGSSARLAPVASCDATRQAFETLLQISRARREQSMTGDQIAGIGPTSSDVPLASPSASGQNPAWDAPHIGPDPVNFAVSGNMEGSLLDLVDWDETLQNFMPMSMDIQEGFH